MSPRAHALRALLLCVLAPACMHSRPALPRPGALLTPSPDAVFREIAPAPLPGLPAWTPPRAQTRVLGNGMEVIVVERHDRPIVSVRYANRAAPAFAAAHPPGLAVLAGDALLEGTIVSDEIVKDYRVAGVRPRVYTSDHGTTVGLDVLSFAAAAAVQVIADLVRHPELGAPGVQAAARAQHDALFEASKRSGGLLRSIEMGVLLGHDHPWAVDAATVQQQLEKLTVTDVQQFHVRNYVPDASALVVVGDVSAEQVFTLAERHFGDWPRAGVDFAAETLAARHQLREVHAVLAGGEQSSLYVVLPAVASAHPQFHAFGLMAQMVAGAYESRSNQTLRHERGATYGVRAELRGYRGGGYLRLSLAVENEQLLGAARTIRSELQRLQNEPVRAPELNTARSGYLSSFDLSSTSGLSDRLAMMQMQGLSPEWLERLEADVAAVTAEQIGDLARAYFDPGRVSIIAVGNLYRTWPDLRQLGKVRAYEIKARRRPSGRSR